MQKRFTIMLVITIMTAFTTLFAQKVDMSLFHGMKPRNIGPAGMSGRVTAIAADPRNYDVFYVGTASGGLWKTTGGGITFEPVFDNELVASIGALAIDPNRPDIIWAGTGEGNPRNSLTNGRGIYKSPDGGKTWKLMGLEKTSNIHRILINPNNSDIVYVGAIGNPWGPNSERGLYKTTDGGETWTQILYNGTTVGVCDMVMDPTNPDKLFVGMWNHQRWPWFFNSGGPGSGLYMTLDGGKNFSRITNGIPDETGRIGLAISTNRPEYVYAYVEARPSAIYRSTNGGFTWEKRGEQGIGSRPFYYAEIHIDPTNENRLFTLFSGINMSEDGGLTFPYRVAESVHLDHHAWWINPENPRHMIEGNDGGMAITYDMGKTWKHIMNLPLGQFYHITVDNEMPYNIYGGLQDNGSWRGPAYKWANGGIINEDWEFLIGGDGFDAMPVPGDPRYCYAQSQGGSVRRVDLLTGAGASIRPTAAPNERLRFNWNSAIAQDPFDNNTIYFGSQFVHKSTDRGDNWIKISEDLTTNNPEKQNTNNSGGITRDATGAEVHCTVITISPSPVQRDVIWAGTDDGNVQVTTDGGKTWTNITPNIKGAPANAWIPQVTASLYNAGEAFVVLNNYRLGDNSAHLYVTRNFGKSWERLIDDTKVWGYVLCFVQDPIEPKLMFAGTEYGLYVSFDAGKIWNKWVNGYPTVSTYDLAIHPREHDLVIGTFGRAVWVLDDIRALREVARSGGAIKSKVLAIEPPVAVMASTKNNPGYYYRGDAMFEGSNRPIAAMLTAYVSDDTEEQLKVEILSLNDVVIREMEVAVKKGFNRFSWRFDRNAAPIAGMIARGGQEGQRGGGGQAARMGGSRVLPGKYKVRMSLGGISSETEITVINDPRMEAPDVTAATKNLNEAETYIPKINAINELYQKFSDCNTTIAKVDEYFRMDARIAEELKDTHTPLKEKYTAAERKLNGRPEGLFVKINSYRVLTTATRELNTEERAQVSGVNSAIAEATAIMNEFMNNEWPQYLEKLKSKKVPLDVLLK